MVIFGLAAGAVTKMDAYIDSPLFGLGVDNGLGDQGKEDQRHADAQDF